VEGFTIYLSTAPPPFLHLRGAKNGGGFTTYSKKLEKEKNKYRISRDVVKETKKVGKGANV